MKEKLKGKSQWIIMGILEVLIGILLLVNPVYFTAGIVIASGVLLILGGLMNGWRYFKASPAVAEREKTLVLCLMGLALGVLCVAGTKQVIAAFPVLTALYGVAILIGGFCKVQLTVDGIRNEHKGWGWPALSAALSIAFAVVILCRPFATTVAIWRFTGITLIVEAVVDALTVLIGGRRAA